MSALLPKCQKGSMERIFISYYYGLHVLKSDLIDY